MRLHVMRLIAGVCDEIQIPTRKFSVDKADAWGARRQNNIGSKIGHEGKSQLFLIGNEVTGGCPRRGTALQLPQSAGYRIPLHEGPVRQPADCARQCRDTAECRAYSSIF